MRIDPNQNITYKSRCSPNILPESELTAQIEKIENPITQHGVLSTQLHLCVFCGQFFQAHVLHNHLMAKHGARRSLPWFFKGFTISSGTSTCSSCPYQERDILKMVQHISDFTLSDSLSLPADAIRHEPPFGCIFCGQVCQTLSIMRQHLWDHHEFKNVGSFPLVYCELKAGTANVFWP